MASLNKTKTVKLSSLMRHLAFRVNADMLFDTIKKYKENTIKLDFKGIETISRSFAHQYLMRKSESKKDITEVNMPERISKMFELVNRQKSVKEIKLEDVEVVEVPAVVA